MNRILPTLLIIATSWIPLTGAERVHPSLFFEQSDVPVLRARAESSSWLGLCRASLLAEATRYLEIPTEPYPVLAAGPGIAGRALQQRVGLLAFAGYLTGDQRFFQKGKTLLLAVTRQTKPRDRNNWAAHLQYSDAAQAFAIGYDWLAPFMTEPERAEVRKQITEFGKLLFTDDTAWGKDDPGVTSCNHNAVHFGALGLCALVLGDHPEWIQRATERVRGYFKYSADETGYVTEGHDYQAYGLLGALPFSTALLHQGGPDLVAEQARFPLTSDQILWKLLPSRGRTLAMNDNDDIPAFATVAYAMLRYRQPLHLWAWLQGVGGTERSSNGVGTLREGLSAPFLFIWANQTLEPEAPGKSSLPLGHRFESGRVFLRSSWADTDAAHVSFTSGYDHHRGHNHQDENAVTFYALGENFLIDPGYQPSGSRSHNTLRSIDGAEQIPGSSGRLIAYREDTNGAFIRGQAPEAYDFSKACVGQFDRKVYFVRGPLPYLAWRDDAQAETDNPKTEFVAQFVTDPKNRIEALSDGFVIHGTYAGAHCLVKVMSPVARGIVAIEDLAGQKFERRSSTFAYAKYYQGVTVTARALNPKFVTLAFPYRSENELPKIELSTEPGDLLVCTLRFADGRVDRLSFSGENGTLTQLAGSPAQAPQRSRQ